MRNAKKEDSYILLPLPRWQKLLIVLFVLSRGSKKAVKYEDIVVEAFKKFPETFHLRGYKEYPDSGDLVHKPLYDMRPRGLLTAIQKEFTLTDKGIKEAKKLIGTPHANSKIHFKPARDVGKEIERILSSDGFTLYKNDRAEKIFDTDFFQYLGISVHSSRSEFLNRLTTIEDTVKQARQFQDTKVVKLLSSYHQFMIHEKFHEIVLAFTNKRERRS